MHSVILYGGTDGDAALAAVHQHLCTLLRSGGNTVERLTLAGMSIRPCTGCFGCWLQTPGECLQADDGRTVARALAGSDLNILLTPVSFGGYSSLTKNAVDRMIPNISPLFQRIDGEMHHRLRYPHPPAFLAVGWQPRPNADSAAIFARLVQRNGLNMHAPAIGSLVLSAAQTPDEQQRQLAAVLRQMEVVA